MNRRFFATALLRAALAATIALVAGASGAALAADARLKPTPIVFVHGNGDTAALWKTTIWRFESNGYPRDRLFAIDFPNPLARNSDAVDQPNRSSTGQQMEQLAAFVQEVKRKTGAEKVALIGSSRGGNAIRNYLRNGGGAAHVSHAILSGTPNHGVVALDDYLVGSEFNGNGPFLRQLNAGPNEVVAGVRFMTIRSTDNDKFAQPEGRFVGIPGKPTNVTPEGPALAGALNVALPKLDHREVAFHPLAFREMHVFVTEREPARLDIVAERRPVLNGKVNGMAGGAPTNLPVAGASVEIFRVSPATGERLGGAVHRRTTGADGLWGPFAADPDAYYEFVLTVPGAAITHTYRSPFPRSSDIVHLRPSALDDRDRQSAAVVAITRPRGYFGHGRDVFLLDGKVPPGINQGVPGASYGKLALPSVEARGIRAVFNQERMTMRAWPTAENRIAIAEFHD